MPRTILENWKKGWNTMTEKEEKNQPHEEYKKEVEDLLQDLTKEDVERIKTTLKALHIVETLGFVMKWAFVSLIALAIAITQLGDSIAKVIKWVKVG